MHRLEHDRPECHRLLKRVIARSEARIGLGDGGVGRDGRSVADGGRLQADERPRVDAVVHQVVQQPGVAAN